MTTMANYWAAAGHEVHLFSFEDHGEVPFYPLHPAVRTTNLSLNRYSPNLLASMVNNWQRLATIRRSVKAVGPDAVVSFIDTANIRTVVALLCTGIPVIVSERVHPGYEQIGRLWGALRRLVYPLADSLVVQTRDIGEFFSGYRLRDLRIIPNAVVAPAAEAGGEALGGFTLLAVGRLYRQKGYDLLLRAFSRVAAKYPDWTLRVAGDGPLRDELDQLTTALSLDGRVAWMGQVADVAGLYARSHAYVMSSSYEGFPNSLCEAMAAGLACVSTDCPSGPADIIRDGENGLLVPCDDEEALAAALDRLMADAELRRTLGAGAADVVDRFSQERIMGMWEECILGAMAKRVGS